MSETGHFRKPRSATASNIDDARLAANHQALSQDAPEHHSSHRLLNPFAWRLRKKRKSQDFSTNSLANAQKTNTMNVNRPVYTQAHFDKGFGEAEGRQGLDFKRRFIKCMTCECTCTCWTQFFMRLFPFIAIMKQYSPREDLVGDIIAGLTVGIMNIPQGMAYALLASVQPIYGLYVSFFPVIVYFFFGTSRHNSIGTFAVVSLMVGAVVDKQCGDNTPTASTVVAATTAAYNATDGNLTTTTAYSTTMSVMVNATTSWFNATVGSSSTTLASLTDEDMTCQIAVFTSLTLMVGIFQILMGVFRLGFLTIYLADPLISGFTTGAACHVFTSQIKYVFGIQVDKFNGAFKLIRSYIDLFSKITTINPAEVIIAVICILSLVLVKQCINDRYKKKMKMPVPIDLIVVVLGTVISATASLHSRFGVKILGDIPAQFPSPTLPGIFDSSAGVDFAGLIQGAATIAIVAFAVSVSMAKIFAKKHNYEIDSNQELVALGMTNSVSSFFMCFTSCASLSRSAVQDNQGGKTQVAGLISCVLVLLVLLFLGPHFASLPNSVLASIILVALKGLFLQFLELKRLWYISYYDFAIWLVTWVAVVVLEVDLGLIVGVVFGLLTVVFRTQYPNTLILGRVPHTDLYKDKAVYTTVQEVNGVKIFRIDAALYYANVEHFRTKLYKLTTVNPRVIKVGRAGIQAKVDKEKRVVEREEAKRQKKLAKQQKQEDNEASAAITVDVGEPIAMSDIVPADNREGWPKVEVHHIIIDCSMMSYVDSVGVNALLSVYTEYSEIGVTVFLCNCKSDVREMFRRTDFYNKVPEDNIYLTIHDSIIAALSRQREQLEEVNRDTKIVSRPASILGEPPNIANLLKNRKGSLNYNKPGSSKGSLGLLPTLMGEDAEATSDIEEREDEDPVNGEAFSQYV